MSQFAPPRALAECDDRTTFDCGVAPMNAWFFRHGWANHRDGISRMTIVTDAASGKIAGYVTLSAGQIDREALPKPLRRNKPEVIPMTLLGQLAVDKAFAGRGLATGLMRFAVMASLAAARSIGIFGLITQPYDPALRPFYALFGFKLLADDIRGAMMLRHADVTDIEGPVL